MRRAISVLAGLTGALTAFAGSAAAAPTASRPTIGRIIALPPAPVQSEAAAPSEPLRFAGNSSSNSSRNSSRNRSRNSSNNTSNNSSDDDRWRYR